MTTRDPNLRWYERQVTDGATGDYTFNTPFVPPDGYDPNQPREILNTPLPSFTMNPGDANFNAVTAIMQQYPWLAQLGQNITQLMVDQVQVGAPYESIVAQIRQTPEYQQRFPGMNARIQSGYNPITEAEYLALEDAYQSQLRSYGVLGILAPDSTAEKNLFADFIGNDVSVSELNRRLDIGTAIVADMAPTVQTAFKEFYGVEISPDALLTYALDPELGQNVIEDQLAAATIGGEAYRYGLNITRTRAELLRREGVTANIARQGFASVAQEQPMLEKLARIHSFSPLTQNELENFFFHEDPNVGARRARIFTQALADFQGSTASLSRQGGLTEFADLNRSF